MAKVPPKTFAEVRAKLDDKIMEASDFLDDMETWKQNQTRFTHRVSAFLSAAESVLFMIEKHARRYARDRGRKNEFDAWYEAQENAFRTPDKAHRGKSVGSDAEWVYVRAARNDTIHIERTNLVHLARATCGVRLNVTVPEAGPEPPTAPPTFGETKERKDLWSFKPIAIVDQGGNITDVVSPPMDDVVSVCERHLNKLRELAQECERELATY